MGNQLTGLSPSQTQPIEHYLQHYLPHLIWSKCAIKSHMGSTRFMKVAKLEHEVEREIVVKIFVAPEKQDVDLELYGDKIRQVAEKLDEFTNCLPWAQVVSTEHVGFLIRQHMSRSLYDRLSMRPFLTMEEKSWITYQLIYALSNIHSKGVVHGDLKCENVLLTQDDWLVLADFANFKPCNLLVDNPADFTYFFDTSRRRAACLAPERFLSKENATSEKNIITPEMDIFSAGCIIAEIFLDGKDPLFSYADLLAFLEGKAPDLSNIPDGYREMVQSMIKRCPNDRPTADDLLISDIFPASFHGFLFKKMSAYKDREKHQLKGTRGDDVIRRLKTDLKEFLSKLSRETLVIPLNLILSAIRSCDFHQSWFDGFDILVQMSTKLDPTIVLERIMPTLLKFTRESDSRLRAASLTALHQIIQNLDAAGLSEQVCEQNAEYLLKDLKDLANDDMFHVKRVYAKYIGTFGRFCYLLSKRCEDEHVSETVRNVINDCVTNVMTDDSAEINREFLHSSVIELAEVLGATNIGDTILKHMITFLNKNHSWMLRAEMYNSLPKVLKSIGLSGDLVDVLRGPIQEGLTDSEDPVILAALKCFTCLVEAGLMSKSLTLDVAHRVTPFLLHPNSAIMLTAARYFVTLGQKMNTAEKMVKLIPVVSKFMKKKNHAALNSLQTFLTLLRPPLSRLVYEQIISTSFTRELVKLLRDYPHHELHELEGLVNSEALDEFLKDTSNSSSSWEIGQKRRKFATLLCRLTQIPMTDTDREALELMSSLLEARHLKKQGRMPIKTTSGTIFLDEVEAERQRRPSRSMASVKLRNVATLKFELSKNEKDRNVLDKKILWATSYFEHNLPNKKELQKEGTNTIKRYSNSKIALREIVYEKRKEIRDQCEEDLMDVSDENFDGFDGSSNDQWLPQGRLVGHIQEHTGSINEITVNPKCSFMCSAGNDGFVKTWSVDQFWNYSNPSEALKSKNQWRPDSEMAIKRVQFCDNSKIAIVAQKENPDSLSTGSICYSDIEMFKTPLWNKVIDAKYGIVTDLCTTKSDKGQILAATSAGQILALDPRSKHTVSQSYELEHDVRLGGITSICSDKRQQWLAAATARGSVVVWDLRYKLRVINFQAVERKIQKILPVPGTQCEVAISVDMNNDVGIWSLNSGFRQKAFWSAKGVPPLSSTPHNGYSSTSMVFSPSGGVLFTGGSDMRIRGWNLAEAKKSRMIVNSASSQAEGHRYDVTYSERKLEGIELIEENRDNIVQVALEESDWGLIGPPPGHWDVISSLQYISKSQTGDKLLVSASRDGCIKLWK